MSGNNATVTVREVIDQQMYSLATARSDNSDPFGVTGLQSKGWTVSREVDENENHVITITKHVALSNLEDAWSEGPISGRMLAAPPTFGGSLGSVQRGLFSDTVALNNSIVPPAPEQPSGGSSSESAQMQAAGRNLAASIIGIHFELLVPGNVVDTNAERTADGALRWDIALDRPTDIHVVYDVPDREHIYEAIGAGLVLLLICAKIAIHLFRRRRRLLRISPAVQ